MHPPVNFHFSVSFRGLAGKDEVHEEGFQSVSGLEAFIDVFSSGNDKKKQKAVVTYSPLILTRAVVSQERSPFARWLFACIHNNHPTVLKSIMITLLDDEHKPTMAWTLKNVLPVSWRLGELNAERAEVLVETITLKYEKLIVNK